MVTQDKDLIKLFKQVSKDLGLDQKRFAYVLKQYKQSYVTDLLVKEAFLLDRNMESVRELRAYLFEVEEHYRFPKKRR